MHASATASSSSSRDRRTSYFCNIYRVTSGRTSILPDCSTLRSQSAQLGNLFLTQPPFYHTWHKAIQRNLRLVFWQPPFYHTGVGSQCENFDSKEINFLSPLSIFVVSCNSQLPCLHLFCPLHRERYCVDVASKRQKWLTSLN